MSDSTRTRNTYYVYVFVGVACLLRCNTLCVCLLVWVSPDRFSVIMCIMNSIHESNNIAFMSIKEKYTYSTKCTEGPKLLISTAKACAG